MFVCIGDYWQSAKMFSLFARVIIDDTKFPPLWTGQPQISRGDAVIYRAAIIDNLAKLPPGRANTHTSTGLREREYIKQVSRKRI